MPETPRPSGWRQVRMMIATQQFPSRVAGSDFVAGRCRDTWLLPHFIHTWLSLNTHSGLKHMPKTHN